MSTDHIFEEPEEVEEEIEIDLDEEEEEDDDLDEEEDDLDEEEDDLEEEEEEEEEKEEKEEEEEEEEKEEMEDDEGFQLKEVYQEETVRQTKKHRIRMDRYCKSANESVPRSINEESFDHFKVVEVLSRYTTEKNAVQFASYITSKDQLFDVCGKLINKEYPFSTLFDELKQKTEWRNTKTFSHQIKNEESEIQIATTTMKVVEGLYQCTRCKSKKTYSRQVQTRSADEGMTSIIQCIECNKVWREYA